MSTVIIPWSTGSSVEVVAEGLRYIVFERSMTHLVYGEGHYRTTFVGPGHMGRQIISKGWQDAATLVRILTGLSLMKEVQHYGVLAERQERELLDAGLSLEESDEIVFHFSSAGWKSYWRRPSAA